MRKVICGIILISCCALGQFVQVKDDVRTPVDDKPFKGEISIIPSAEMSYLGVTYARQIRRVRINDGQVNLTLIPNVGAAPSGTHYRATFKGDDQTTWVETWIVSPSVSQVTISSIRSTVPRPTTSISLSQIPVCSENQIIKTVSGVWVCSVEVGGSGDLTTSAIIDLPSVPDGTCHLSTTVVTLTGASLGGRPTIGYSFTPPEGVTIGLKVSGPNSVKIEVCNWSGAAYDAASSIFYLGVTP